MKCKVCNGTGYVSIGEGVRGIKKCDNCGGLGEVSIYKNGTCENCGAPIPTDDTYDFIPEGDVKYCYHCGAKIERKIQKVNHVFEFETDEDWVPGESACWICCPFASLIRLGESCKFIGGALKCPFLNMSGQHK